MSLGVEIGSYYLSFVSLVVSDTMKLSILASFVMIGKFHVLLGLVEFLEEIHLKIEQIFCLLILMVKLFQDSSNELVSLVMAISF